MRLPLCSLPLLFVLVGTPAWNQAARGLSASKPQSLAQSARLFAHLNIALADAYLAVVSGKRKGSKVWTYDREFRTTWRRPDGTRIPLAAG